VNILVAIDLSDASARVIDVCEHVAKAMSATVWVLHVAEAEPDFVGYDAGPDVVRDQVAREFRDEHKAVQSYAHDLRQSGLEAIALLIQGPIVETILKEAERLQIDLMIVGSHGFGPLYDLVVGSSSRGILKHTKVPVLVVPVRKD